ncbi:MAG: putative membrane protein [Gammaproteobacteria bacterium]|jgi:putative membrane protein
MMKKKAVLVAKGFCMGAADVVPGVSGGTMAFILGIYAELIAAIRSFDKESLLALLRLDVKSALSRPHFGFLIPLGLGVLGALLFFTRIVHLPDLLRSYPEQIYGLFFGLIVGSIILLITEMKELQTKDYLMIVPGLVLGLLVFNLVPTETPETAWFVFLSGALAICAMILPGISGSFILLVLNKYAYIFNAIGYFNFSVLIPFGLGAITGLLLFSRVLSYLLSKYYRRTILFISGLLIASLYVIWPFQDRIYEIVREKPRLIASRPVLPSEISSTVVVSIALLVVGLVVVIALSWMSNRKQT